MPTDLRAATATSKRDDREFLNDAEDALAKSFGPGNWIRAFYNGQFVLNQDLAAEKGIELSTVESKLTDYLLTRSDARDAFTAKELLQSNSDDHFRRLALRGYYPTRSGDVYCIFTSGTLFDHSQGTTHGSAYVYDTHVPFLIAGPNVPVGKEVYGRVEITQVAPTIAALLHITEPSAAFDTPLPIFPTLAPASE